MMFLDISCERSIRNSWHITDVCIEIFLWLPPAWISSSVQASMKPHGCLAVDGLKMYHFAESFLTPNSMVYHHVLHRSCKFWGLCTFFSQSHIKTYQNHWGSSKTRLYPSRPCPAPWFWAYFLRSSLREGPGPYPYDLKLVWSIFFQSFPISPRMILRKEIEVLVLVIPMVIPMDSWCFLQELPWNVFLLNYVPTSSNATQDGRASGPWPNRVATKGPWSQRPINTEIQWLSLWKIVKNASFHIL